MALNTLKRKTSALVTGRTTTGAASPVDRPRGCNVFQVAGQTSSGSGSVTVKLQGTNDKTKTVWNDIATLVLTLSTVRDSQEFSLRQATPYRFYRSNTTAISGTGAQHDSFMGVR
jgi:hypothetical protein